MHRCKSVRQVQKNSNTDLQTENESLSLKFKINYKLHMCANYYIENPILLVFSPQPSIQVPRQQEDHLMSEEN